MNPDERSEFQRTSLRTLREMANATLESGRANQPLTCQDAGRLLFAFSAAWLDVLVDLIGRLEPAGSDAPATAEQLAS